MLTPIPVRGSRNTPCGYLVSDDQGPDACASEPWIYSAYRLLLQKLEDQLRLLIGLRQHGDTGLFQHLRLRQARRFLREVRIFDGAARLGQVLARGLQGA